MPRPPVARALCARPKGEPSVPASRPFGDDSAVFAPAVPSTALLESGDAERVSGHVLASLSQRLLDGELYAPTSRLDWALLLKRTFAGCVAEVPMLLSGGPRLFSFVGSCPVALSGEARQTVNPP